MVKHARKTDAERKLTLAQRRAYMTLSLEKRRKMLASQAERMISHYEQESESSERETWQGGDIVDP